MQATTLPKTDSGKLKFPGISLKAIQHKFDSVATEGLKKIPLLPQLFKILNKIFSEEALYVIFTGQALRVTPNQYSRLYKVYREAIEILDLPYEPEFFLQTAEVPNAFAMGMDRKFVVVTSGLTEILTEEELLFVIGHELGHNKFDHMLNKTIAYILGSLGVGVITAVLGGVGQLAALSLQLGLLHWSRMAEFSADRAGFLVVQDRNTALRALSKLAGYSHKYSDGEVNIDEVLMQARQLDETNLLQTVHKYIAMLQMTHPFVPYRVKELDEWIKSQECQNILNGMYITEEEYFKRFGMYQQPSYPGPGPYPQYPYQQPYYQQQPFPSYPQQPYPNYPQQPYPQYPQQPYTQQSYPQQPYQPNFQQPPYFQQPYNPYQGQQQFNPQFNMTYAQYSQQQNPQQQSLQQQNPQNVPIPEGNQEKK